MCPIRSTENLIEGQNVAEDPPSKEMTCTSTDYQKIQEPADI